MATGELNRLVASLVRHCDRAIILSDMEAGRIARTRIGGPLLFGRLWQRLGIATVLDELLAHRGFEFAGPSCEQRAQDGKHFMLTVVNSVVA